jgi:hypothetical protein
MMNAWRGRLCQSLDTLQIRGMPLGTTTTSVTAGHTRSNSWPSSHGNVVPSILGTLGGARACPPEDCGGVPGYYRLLKILADTSDEEHEEMVEWLEEHAKNYFPYHPEAFDPAAVRFLNPKEALEGDDGA